MLRLIPILLLLVASPAWADDPVPAPVPVPVVTPAIVFPVLPTPDKVQVTPAPPADPDAVPALVYGQVYVVQSDVDFILLASPANLVALTPPTAGPITVRGLFADGSGKIETRTFKSKYVAFVDAVENGAGRVELIAIPVGVVDESAVVRQLVDIGAGPRPPPDPIPVPVPDPVVPPTPAPVGFRVLMIYETSANNSREQLNTLHSTAIAKYLDAKCAKSESGKPEWRRWDPNVEIRASESKTMRDLWATVKPSLLKPDGTIDQSKLPLIVVSVNGVSEGHQLPATVSESDIIAKLKSKGGE